MKRHIIIALDAPMMSFGDHNIDARVPTARFPTTSQLTGMIGNALGYDRLQAEKLARLQRRIRYAARIERAPAGLGPLTDFQTADINADDRGWTTRGAPEGRKGAKSTYRGSAPAISHREYHADALVSVALRLEPGDESPTLSDIVNALIKPRHPLFIGRKSCPPADRLYQADSYADTALSALLAAPLSAPDERRSVVMWRAGEGADGVRAARAYPFADERNWRSGLHGGGKIALEADIILS